MLGLGSLEGRRAIIVGAGPLGHGLAEILRRHGRPVVLVYRNQVLIAGARASGIDAIEGNALDESVLEQAGAEEAETLIAVTTNSEVNALAAHLAHDAFGITRAHPVRGHPSRGAGASLVDRVGGDLAFGQPINVRAWEYQLEHGDARFMSYTLESREPNRPVGAMSLPDGLVPIARIRGGSVEFSHAGQVWQRGDEIVLLSRFPEDAARTRLDVSRRIADHAHRDTPAPAVE